MAFTLFLGTVLTLSWMIYFSPYMVALGRGHQSTLAISMVNLFFGWCIFGWIASLIWACSSPGGSQPQIIVNTGNNAAIIPASDKPKGKPGRIVLLMILLTILGYLSAFAAAEIGTSIRDAVETQLSSDQAAVNSTASDLNQTPADKSTLAVVQGDSDQAGSEAKANSDDQASSADLQAIPEQEQNQANLAQSADSTAASAAVAASS